MHNGIAVSTIFLLLLLPNILLLYCLPTYYLTPQHHYTLLIQPMKIQCDVCEKAPATVICCADEAALCTKCDVEVHAANKLASKHQRLHLQCLSSNLPICDICQEKPAFIFCVEDRALFCQDCDDSIHPASSLSANHQRFLATGIKVALSSSTCSKETEKTQFDPPTNNQPQMSMKVPQKQQASDFSPSWGVDELLQFSDFDSSDKQKEQMDFGEVDWMSLFGDQIPQEPVTAAEVPQLPMQTPNHCPPYRTSKSNSPHKKPRFEIAAAIDEDDDEFFTVPDLG